MRSRTVLLAVENAAAMGRGVIHGAASYAHGRQAWTLAPVSRKDRENPTVDVSPRVADAVIGAIDEELAELWRGEDRRRVVNVSRGRHVAGAANVTCDDAGIGRMAGAYLRGKGLEHFAYFGPANSGQRAEAFIDAVHRPGWPVPHLDSEADSAALESELKHLPRPCGVLAFNDTHAVRLITLARSLEIDVPGELAVVGVDNDVMVSILSLVQVTSVAVDFEEVGYEAARVLDGVFRGGEPPAEPIRIPPTEVIERHSTDFPGDLDPLAVQAARLIRVRACEGVSVPEMIDELPASYRTVDRRFREAFGRSLQAELMAARMEEAARLLTTTKLPLWAIAQRVGYSDAGYFNKAFRKQIGTPPATYRRQHEAASR